MAKENRARGRRRHEDRSVIATVTKIKGPADLIAMIPYVVGFTPAESLVVVALQGPRQRFGPCIRLDLAADSADAAAQAAYLVEVIAAHRFDPVVVVAFSADAERADAVVQPLRRGLARRRIRVAEALRADGRRWWSYACSDPDCCSPAGSPYDPDSSRVAAEAVLSGLQKAPDRESLGAQFEPADGEVRRAVRQECDRLRAHRLDVEDLDRLVVDNLAAPDTMSISDIAALLLAIQHVSLRDAAWGLLNRANADSHFMLWRRVMQTAPDDLMAPAGALAGFAAWLDGRGAHAALAAERVERVSPGYSMGRLLQDILRAAVSPDVWRGFPLQRDPTRR